MLMFNVNDNLVNVIYIYMVVKINTLIIKLYFASLQVKTGCNFFLQKGNMYIYNLFHYVYHTT